MDSADSFCLRWNDFESNISSSFRDLRENDELFDVTLCCDNGTDVVRAHKVILAACSPLFRRIFSHNSQQNPFLYLKGIQKKDLLMTLAFMYNGQVNVAQDELNNFLSVAEELAVKGLTSNETAGVSNKFNGSDVRSTRSSATHRRATKRHQASPNVASKSKSENDERVDVKRIKAEVTVECDADTNDVDAKFEVRDGEEEFDSFGGQVEFNEELEESGLGTPGASGSAGAESRGFANLDELEAKMVAAVDNSSYRCAECDYLHKKRAQMLSHIESFHFSNSYTCEHCHHVCPTLGALKKHIYRNHRNKNIKKSLVAMDHLNLDFLPEPNFDESQ